MDGPATELAAAAAYAGTYGPIWTTVHAMVGLQLMTNATYVFSPGNAGTASAGPDCSNPDPCKFDRYANAAKASTGSQSPWAPLRT